MASIDRSLLGNGRSRILNVGLFSKTKLSQWPQFGAKRRGGTLSGTFNYGQNLEIRKKSEGFYVNVFPDPKDEEKKDTFEKIESYREESIDLLFGKKIL
jgi:hypothetical protein